MDLSRTRQPDAAQRRWRDVVARVDALPAPSPDDLARRAEALWWLCDIPRTIEAEEGLHQALLADDRRADAALRGLRLALLWGTRGDLSLAQAWLERAVRLLRDEPDSVVHGYATYLAAAVGIELGEDGATTVDTAERLRLMADHHADRTLECFALVVAGIGAVRSGDLGGYAALDEALIPVLGGQVDPFWGGDIFCSVIHLCEQIGDLGRMRAWTASLEAWATPLSSTFLYNGVTRVHQLQLLRAAGEWDLVEREIGEWSSALADAHGWVAGAGFYELGEVHRLRGRDAEAQAAYDLTRTFGIEPQPGEALLLHARGESSRALDGLLIALAGAGPLERARLIPGTVEVARATGDLDRAQHLAAELEATAARFGTPGLLAAAARARASCLCAEWRWSDAEVPLETAARLHRQQGQRHEIAQVHELLAEVHRRCDRPGQAAAAEATARAIYAALGAAADLERLSSRRRVRPAGLTEREIAVLVRVAAGQTNKQVARELVISDKTVGRHLSNIFAKTGVASRTGAAAWAREHGVL